MRKGRSRDKKYCSSTISGIIRFVQISFGFWISIASAVAQEQVETVFLGPTEIQGVIFNTRIESLDEVQFSVQTQFGASIVDRVTGRRDGRTLSLLNVTRELAAINVDGAGDIALDQALLNQTLNTRLSNFGIDEISFGSRTDQRRFQGYIQTLLRARAFNDIYQEAINELASIQDFLVTPEVSGQPPLSELVDIEPFIDTGEQFYLDLYNDLISDVENQGSLLSALQEAATFSARPLLEAIQTVGVDGAAVLWEIGSSGTLAAVSAAINEFQQLSSDFDSAAATTVDVLDASTVSQAQFDTIRNQGFGLLSQVRIAVESGDYSPETLSNILGSFGQFESSLRNANIDLSTVSQAVLDGFASEEIADQLSEIDILQEGVSSAQDSFEIFRNYQRTLDEYAEYFSPADMQYARNNQFNILAVGILDAIATVLEIAEVDEVGGRSVGLTIASARAALTLVRVSGAGLVNINALFSGNPVGTGSFTQIDIFNEQLLEASLVAFVNAKFYESIFARIGLGALQRYSQPPLDFASITPLGIGSLNSLEASLNQIENDLLGVEPENTPMPSLGVVANLSATTSFSNRIQVNWLPANDADFYQVFFCESVECNSRSAIGSVENTQFIDSPISSSSLRFYSVAACNNNGCGDLSRPVAGSIALPAISADLLGFDIPDDSVFDQGSQFTENWRFLNTGDATWDSSTCMRRIGGVALSAASQVCVQGSVPPGDEFTFSVDFIAPAASTVNTRFEDQWNLSQGNQLIQGGFGRVRIIVPLVIPTANQVDDLTLIDAAPTSLTLSWPQDDSGSFYELQRALGQGEFSFLTNLESLTFEDRGLTPNTTYRYRLRRCISSSVDSCSSFSNTLQLTTPAAASADSLISRFEVSNDAPLVGQTIILDSTLANGGGIANNDRFQFVYALGMGESITNENQIIFRANDGAVFNLDAGQSLGVLTAFQLPDSTTPGAINLLACALFDDLDGEVQQACEVSPIIVNSLPLVLPDSPPQPSIFYTQGGSQLSVGWNDSNGGEFFRLERSTTNTSSGFLEVASGNIFTFQDSDIDDNINYFYRVRACQNSLINTCSQPSPIASVSTLETASNDFFVTNFEASRNGSSITLEATQNYQGTSQDQLGTNIGFFLSPNEICSVDNDLFLGSARSTLRANDLFDNEEVSVPYPSIGENGTFFVCAVADFDQQFGETNESNNQVSLLINTNVPAPILEPLRTLNDTGQIRVSWPAVPGNVQYRLEASSTQEGFENGTSTTIFLSTSERQFVENGLPTCSARFYRLLSCNGTSGDANCSVSPISSALTLLTQSPQPNLRVISENKIEVTLGDDDTPACGQFFIVEQRPQGASRFERIHTDASNKFVDLNLQPNTTYEYRAQYCDSEQRFRNNGCSGLSGAVSATTLLESPANENWQERTTQSDFINRAGEQYITFNNRLWSFGGLINSVSTNDIFVSNDGLEFEKIDSPLPFSPREFFNLVVHQNRIFIFGGSNRSENGTRTRLNDVWSSQDGANWVLETSNSGIPLRNSGATLNSFGGRMYLIGGDPVSTTSQILGDELSDIWSSVDGVTWVLETNNATFSGRSFHQVIEINERLFLYGGDGVDAPEQGDQLHDDIWSSSNGIDWVLEREGLPYSGRDVHYLLEFAGDYWLIGGRRRVQRDADFDNIGLFFEEDSIISFEDDVWRTSDGLNWSIADEATPFPSTSPLDAINFNNQIIVQPTQSRRWVANYGNLVSQPEGELEITGAVIEGNSVEANLDNIELEFDLTEVTYQWFRNGDPIDGEVNSSLVLEGFEVGETVSLVIRYTNSELELFEFSSASFEVLPNPITSEFRFNNLVSDLRAETLSNEITEFEASYSVELSSDNTSVATVSESMPSVMVVPVGVGSTSINAMITDAVSGASRVLSFDVVVNQAQQTIGFGTSSLALGLDSQNFTLRLVSPGESTGDLRFSSSNSPVVQVTGNGGDFASLQLLSPGEAMITAIRDGDDNYLETSTTILLTVFDDDLDSDGVVDVIDNCPNDPNASQSDLDRDSIGDVCDEDLDGDFALNQFDCEVTDSNLFILRDAFPDLDSDGFGFGNLMEICSGEILDGFFADNGSDNCPNISNSDQADFDNDLQGNLCDEDDDNDLTEDGSDCAPLDAERFQIFEGFLDIDNDGIGFGLEENVCSGLSLPNGFSERTNDNCQFDSNPDQINSDNDPLGDACDDDDDNDTLLDFEDNCPTVENQEQLDSDFDGVGDACAALMSDDFCFPIVARSGNTIVICL